MTPFYNIRETTVDELRAELIQIFDDIVKERQNQQKKHGNTSHPNGTGFHYQEMCQMFQKLTKYNFQNDEGSWIDILLEEVFEAAAEEDPDRLRAELIQVAATACAWVKDLDNQQDPTIFGNDLKFVRGKIYTNKLANGLPADTSSGYYMFLGYEDLARVSVFYDRKGDHCRMPTVTAYRNLSTVPVKGEKLFHIGEDYLITLDSDESKVKAAFNALYTLWPNLVLHNKFMYKTEATKEEFEALFCDALSFAPKQGPSAREVVVYRAKQFKEQWDNLGYNEGIADTAIYFNLTTENELWATFSDKPKAQAMIKSILYHINKGDKQT